MGYLFRPTKSSSSRAINVRRCMRWTRACWYARHSTIVIYKFQAILFFLCYCIFWLVLFYGWCCCWPRFQTINIQKPYITTNYLIRPFWECNTNEACQRQVGTIQASETTVASEQWSGSKTARIHSWRASTELSSTEFTMNKGRPLRLPCSDGNCSPAHKRTKYSSEYKHTHTHILGYTYCWHKLYAMTSSNLYFSKI